MIWKMIPEKGKEVRKMTEPKRCPTCDSPSPHQYLTIPANVSGTRFFSPCKKDDHDAWHDSFPPNAWHKPSLRDTPASKPPLLKDISTEWVTETSEGNMTVHHLMVGGVLCRWWGDGPEPSGVARLAALISGDTAPEICETCGGTKDDLPLVCGTCGSDDMKVRLPEGGRP